MRMRATPTMTVTLSIAMMQRRGPIATRLVMLLTISAALCKNVTKRDVYDDGTYADLLKVTKRMGMRTALTIALTLMATANLNLTMLLTISITSVSVLML